MKNKQYPPRGGPPLVYRCRGSGFGTRVFRQRHPLAGPTAHLKINPIRIEEDVGPPGWQKQPLARDNTQAGRPVVRQIPEGLHVYRKAVNRENSTPIGVAPFANAWCYKHLMPLASRDRRTNRARDGTVFRICDSVGAGIAVGFPERMAMPNQRIEKVLPDHGLQPHLTMRLWPVVRQIPEGLYVYSQPVSKENSTPIGVAPSANDWCYKHLMPLASAVGNIAVGFPKGMAMPNQRIEKAHASAGLQPHLINMRLKPEELNCPILIRQLKQTAMEEKQTAMEEKQSATDNKAGRTGRKARHVGKTRDKPAAVYKPRGRMNERFGNTGPPPGRTGQNARKDIRQVWKCSSGGGEYPLREREHPFGDRKYSFGDRKYPLGNRNDSLWDHNDSLGNRNDSLWDHNDSLGNRNDSLGNRNDSPGNRNDSLGDWNDSLGNRNNSLWDRNDSLGDRKHPFGDGKGLVSGSAAGIAVGFNQRKKDAFIFAGLQPHLPMRLKPEELHCSTLPRQLKQTAMEEKQTAIDNLYGSPNLQGLKTWNKAREPAGQPPEKVCRSGTRVERARDDTDNVFRDNPESNRENLHNRHGTAVRAGFSTGLGSRKTAEKRPVIPPEWERYAEKLEVGSTKMEDGRPKTEVGTRPAAAPQNLCSMRYYLVWMKVQRTETLNGNMKCKIRKTEDGSWKTEDGSWKTEDRTRKEM